MLARIKLAFLAFFAIPSVCLAAACEAPPFAETTLSAQRIEDHFPIHVAAAVLVAVPPGFDRMTVSSHSVVLSYPNNLTAVIGLDTNETIGLMKAGSKAGVFYRDVFAGADAYSCEVLAGFELAKKDYRVRLKNKNVEVFAYGKGAAHQFYAIRDDRPDLVVGGRFNGIDRRAFEAILSSIASR